MGFLISTLSPTVKTSWDGEDTPEEFKTTWHLGSRTTPVWRVLQALLRLGGDFVTPAVFCAPYVYVAFPRDIPVDEAAVIIGDRVPLRARPALTAPTIRYLDGNIVTVDYRESVKRPGTTKNDLMVDYDSYEWLRVSTGGGESGFVPASEARSPADYRACFEEQGGAWRLTSLIAGNE